MRILTVSNIFPPEVLGGYEIECAQVSDALHQRGHEILVLTSSKIDQKLNHRPYPILSSLRLFLPFGKEITSAMRWKKWLTSLHNCDVTQQAIATFKPDILFFWSPLRLGMGPARAAKKKKVPIVWRFGDESIGGFIPKGSCKSFKELYRWICDHLIFSSATVKGLPFDYSSCISRITKKRLIEHGLPIEDSEVIYKGIPIALFPEKEKKGYSSPIRILYVGQLHPDKGVHTLIKACKKLYDQQIKATLTIVGRGSPAYTKELEEISTEGIPTKFLGFVNFDELPKIYREHDIFVFPSEWVEPQGTTFLEAMSSGVCVVATARGGQGEILQDEINALIFEAGNADSLSGALLRLINDENLYKKLVVNARRYVETKFSFSSLVDNLEALLIKAVS